MSVLSYESDLQKLKELRERNHKISPINNDKTPENYRSLIEDEDKKHSNKESFRTPVVNTTSCAIHNAMNNWSEKDLLIQWFLSVNSLPTEPFQLNSAVKVLDPKRFYAFLHEDIACGPKGIRAKFGALQNDLLCLKKIHDCLIS